MHKFLKFIFGIKLYVFRTVPLSIIRSFSLYKQHWCMSYRFTDSLLAGSGWNSFPSWSCSQAVWHTPMLCLQWKTPDDGQRNCPKHVEFYSKNKFEKLVHLVGFVIWTVRKLCCNDHQSSSGGFLRIKTTNERTADPQYMFMLAHLTVSVAEKLIVLHLF